MESQIGNTVEHDMETRFRIVSQGDRTKDPSTQ